MPDVADLAHLDVWTSQVAPTVVTPQVLLLFLSGTGEGVVASVWGAGLGSPPGVVWSSKSTWSLAEL